MPEELLELGIPFGIRRFCGSSQDNLLHIIIQDLLWIPAKASEGIQMALDQCGDIYR
jgi:predicted metallopeptidase